MNFVNDDLVENPYFYTSFEEGIYALSSSHERFLNQTELQIEELKRRRNFLQIEIQNNNQGSGAFPGKVLTISSIHGYFLSNYNKEIINSNTTIFSADGCVVKNQNFFSLKVTMEDNIITNVSIHLTENSPLWEIYTALDTLSKQNSPSLLLLTIHRFMRMNCLRKNIALKLITCPKKTFRVFLPKNSENRNQQVCQIFAYRNGIQVLEVNWKMVWSVEYNSLIHHFTCDGKDPDGNLLMADLSKGPFCYNNEKDLEDIWRSYQNHLILLS